MDFRKTQGYSAVAILRESRGIVAGKLIRRARTHKRHAMNENAEYLHLKPGAALPALWVPTPFRAVVIAETPVPPEWQAEVSEWLLRAGCLYVMAWGNNCSTWDD